MFLFGLPMVLRDENNDGGESGSGGSGEFTPEQLEQIEGIIGAQLPKVVNSAVTSQMGRAMPKALAEAFGSDEFKAVMKEQVKDLVPTGGQGGSGSDDDKKKAGSEADEALRKRVEELATNLESETKARQEAERLRQESENQRVLDGGITRFRELVQPKVIPGLLDPFVKLSRESITLDDDGQPVLTVMRPKYKGGKPEEQKVVIDEEGVKDFLSNKQFQPFLPAPGGGGGGKKNQSGSGARQRVQGGDVNQGEEDVWADLEAAGVTADSLLT